MTKTPDTPEGVVKCGSGANARYLFTGLNDRTFPRDSRPTCTDGIRVSPTASTVSFDRATLQDINTRLTHLRNELRAGRTNLWDALGRGTAAYDARIRELYQELAAAAKNPQRAALIQAEIDDLSRRFHNFKNAAWPLQRGANSLEQLEENAYWWGKRIFSAIEVYENGEYQILQILARSRGWMPPSALNCIKFPGLAAFIWNGQPHELQRSLNLPDTFSLGGRKVSTVDLTDTQRVALVMSGYMELVGDLRYGDLGRVAVHGGKETRVVDVPSVWDDAEMRNSLLEYLVDSPRFASIVGIATLGAEVFNSKGLESGMLFRHRIRRAFREAGMQVPPFASPRSPREKRLDLGVHPMDPKRVPKNLPQTISHTMGIDVTDRGTCEISNWTTAEGKRAWRVTLRGTTNWNAGGPLPQDDLTNMQAVANLPSANTVAIKEMIDMAGIPAGEPIEFVGHSQAGIVLTQLAADPEFTRTHNLVSVVTAGSPVGNFQVPEKVSVISLEETSDLVPTLDWRDNPRQENWTTIYADTNKWSPLKAHDLANYRGIAQQLVKSEDPEIVARLRQRAESIYEGQPIVSASTQRFEFERVN